MAVPVSLVGWYAIILGVISAVVLVVPHIRKAWPWVDRWLKRHLVYPILAWKLTRLHFLQLFLYMALNTFALVLFLQSYRDLEQRAALLSTVNLIPLFLGGRVSPLVNAADVSSHTYWFWHYCIGFTVTAQGLLHGIIIFYFQPKAAPDQGSSGWIVVALFGILLLSPLALRNVPNYKAYLHLLLALGVLVVLFRHLVFQEAAKQVAVFVAAAIWACSLVWRLRLFRYSRDIEATRINGMIRLKVRLQHSIPARPGLLFSIYFPDAPLRYTLCAWQVNAYFWTPSHGEGTKELYFILRESRYLPKVEHIKRLVLQGPHGCNLRLERFETVTLAAEGVALAGILPYALDIVRRRKHNESIGSKPKRDDASPPRDNSSGLAPQEPLYGLRTRKVNLVWSMDSSAQMKWYQEELDTLQTLDSHTGKAMVDAKMFHPKQSGELVLPTSKLWNALPCPPWGVNESIAHLVDRESLSAGGSVFVVAGSPGFSRRLRDHILSHHLEQRSISFVEIDFLPEVTASLRPEGDAGRRASEITYRPAAPLYESMKTTSLPKAPSNAQGPNKLARQRPALHVQVPPPPRPKNGSRSLV